MEIRCKCVAILMGGKWDKLHDICRRVYSVEYIAPTITHMGGGNREVKIMETVDVVGNVNPSGNGMNGNVYDGNKLSPALTTNKGEGIKILEPSALRMVRTEEGKAIRKAYENHEIECGFNEHRIAEPRGDGVANTLSTVQKDNYIAEPVISAMRGRNKENPSDRSKGIPTEQRLEINRGGCSNTLTTVQKDNMLVEPGIRVRRLTPRECWRLMGFSDEDFDKAEKVTSNSQLYKQAGNSIVVNVLMAIFKEMLPE